MARRYTPSLRTKFLLIVLIGAVLPLGLFGIWLSGTAERSAENILRDRLDSSLRQIVVDLSGRWIAVRSSLLDLADAAEPQRAWEAETQVRANVTSVVFEDVEGVLRWRLPGEGSVNDPEVADPGPVFPVSVPAYEAVYGTPAGIIDARVRLAAILPGTATWGGVAGSILSAFDPATGASLLQTPFDPVLWDQNRFTYGQEEWITERVELEDPPLELALSAPLTPFVEPFSEAASQNLLLLIVVVVAGAALAGLMSWPITRSLASLASAADAVTEGRLEAKVDLEGSDEVGRLARAFNAMTESLNDTLRRLSQQEALASVGEFAAGLAHEIRNPLTSMRVDLQRVEEELPEESEARFLIGDLLHQVNRLDRSMTGALRLARSGQIERASVDLRQPLQAAAHEAAPQFQTKGATLIPLGLGSDPIWVWGNSPALQQLFLNLLLNAAEALKEGGRGGVELKVETGQVIISVWDEGEGIPEEAMGKVFDPFFSTKPEGTGLGLAIAHRIAVAHGADVSLESSPSTGTRIEVSFTRVQESFEA
jgi:signal transduction histidine kinase